jgi:hypothetical protein
MGAQSSMPDAEQVKDFIKQKSTQGVSNEKA